MERMNPGVSKRIRNLWALSILAASLLGGQAVAAADGERRRLKPLPGQRLVVGSRHV